MSETEYQVGDLVDYSWLPMGDGAPAHATAMILAKGNGQMMRTRYPEYVLTIAEWDRMRDRPDEVWYLLLVENGRNDFKVVSQAWKFKEVK